MSEGELAKAQEDQRILEKQVTKVENILMELRNAMYSELFNRDGYVQSSTSSQTLLPYLFENSGEVPIEEVLKSADSRLNPEDYDRSLLIIEHLIKSKT